jgi:signal transduction histidine kinase
MCIHNNSVTFLSLGVYFSCLLLTAQKTRPHRIYFSKTIMLKRFEINSIRGRMVTGFLFLTFLILILAIISLSIMDRITHTSRMHSTISQLEINTLSLLKSDNDFFDLETINESYFKTRTSNFLTTRESLNKNIHGQLRWLMQEEQRDAGGMHQTLATIDSTLSVYNAKFRQLEALVFKKGFKDYGLEGAMRNHAHALEEVIATAYVSDLLYLRRHEKDFLLRNDTAYLAAFDARAFELENLLRRHERINQKALDHLLEYRRHFIELSEIQMQLGLTSEAGLRNELNTLTYFLSQQYYQLSEYSYKHANVAYRNMRLIYIILFSGAVIFSLVSGYWISKRLSAPIARLSRIMRDALATRSASKTDFRIRNAAIEISTLAESFIQLMNQVTRQMEKVKKKSELLKEKNKELKKLNRELDNFLYSTAHDLRSPLSSLLGLVNLVRHENQQPQLTTYFDLMEKSIYRSEEFISQIVQFSKNKKTSIHPERIELKTLLHDIFESHQFLDGAPLVTRSITLNDSVPFYSDRNRVVILFNNLISNALKYADHSKPEPAIRIDIVVTRTEIQIEFADNGLGIEPEHIDKIFDMFYRAHTHSKGSGLGLFIFKETLTRLNGQVSVESTVGVGTRFALQIPNLYPMVVGPVEKEMVAMH